eukprot:scaffold12875_cov20-Prasinocladus_malaysianus.AAC.1
MLSIQDADMQYHQYVATAASSKNSRCRVLVRSEIFCIHYQSVDNDLFTCLENYGRTIWRDVQKHLAGVIPKVYFQATIGFAVQDVEVSALFISSLGDIRL